RRARGGARENSERSRRRARRGREERAAGDRCASPRERESGRGPVTREVNGSGSLWRSSMFLSSFLICLALDLVAPASPPGDGGAGAEDLAAAKHALESLGAGALFSGTVTRDEGDESFGAGGVRIMNGSGATPEFTGAFELVLTREGELCAVSSSLLPE